MAKSNAPAVQTTQAFAPPMGGAPQMGASTSVIPAGAWLLLIGVPIAIGGAYFLLIKPLLNKLGGQSDADKAAEQLNDKVKSQPYWSGAYYKSGQGRGATLQPHQAGRMAQKLYDCMHGWTLTTPFGIGTDETCITGVFNLLGSKGNISIVSEQYALMYNLELYADMESELEDTEMFAVTQKISQYAI
tara:strand:- start:43 stop:606 length:564 start_codon:yes stop_codon:yes gene_type:complete